MGLVCWLQWLAEQPQPDAAQATALRRLVEQQFRANHAPFLTGYLPRWSPTDPKAGRDLSVTARYAHVLARLGAREEATKLTQALLAAPTSPRGLIDHQGRTLPGEPKALANEDAHAYFCLKAAFAWELLVALDLLEKK